MRKILILFIIFSSSICFSQEFKVENTHLGRWKEIKIENSLIAIGICPQIGFRVVDYRMKTGRNWLRVEKGSYLNKGPLDVGYWQWGRNYGGMFDVGAPTWPGIYFFCKNYPYKIKEKNGSIEIKGWATAQNILLTRTMKLYKNSTVFNIDISEKNVGRFPKEMMLRLHNEFLNYGKTKIIFFNKKVGDLGRKKIDGKILEESQPVKVNYIIGNEEGRGIYNIPYAWVAAINVTDKEVMVRQFNPKDTPNFLLWIGGPIHEGRVRFYEEPVHYHGFYNIEPFHTSAIVLPQHSIKTKETQFFVKGFKDVDFYVRDKKIVGDIELNNKIYDNDGIAKITSYLGCPEARNNTYRYKVEIINPSGNVLKTWAEKTRFIHPGEANIYNLYFPINLKDGVYYAILKFYLKGKPAGIGWEKFSVETKKQP